MSCRARVSSIVLSCERVGAGGSLGDDNPLQSVAVVELPSEDTQTLETAPAVSLQRVSQYPVSIQTFIPVCIDSKRVFLDEGGRRMTPDTGG